MIRLSKQFCVPPQLQPVSYLCYIIPQITIGLNKAKKYLISNTFVFWAHRISIIVHFKCQVTSWKAARSLERLTDKTLQTKTAAVVLDNTLT